MPNIAADQNRPGGKADSRVIALGRGTGRALVRRLTTGTCLLFAGLGLQPSPLLISQAEAKVPLAASRKSVQSRMDEAPNIIVIVADDLGYRDLGAYGGKVRTPNIDALARSGIRYDTAYATAPTCSPSRAGLLSGRSQQRFGFYFNLTGREEAVGMPGSETTIAEVAKRANYRTAMVGKWHVGSASGGHPLDQGFDSFYGFMGGATRYYPDGATGLVDADAGADSLVTRAKFPIIDGHTIVTPQGNLTDVFTNQAVDFIRKNRQQPFFLYLAYNAPHMPLQATEDDVKPFAGLPVFDQVYHAMMTTLDRDVGRVTGELRALGLSRKTIVIFVSDNGCPNYVRGACSNAPLSGYKAYPLEGGSRVPFILSAPGRVRAGQVEKRPISTLDIMPTIAGALQQPAPAESEGVNLLPTVRTNSDRALFWRMGPNYWVRQGPWKMIVINKADSVQDLKEVIGKPMATDVGVDESPLGQWKMLFNLDRDIGEKTDVSAQNPEVVARLEALYQQWNARNIDPAFTSRREFRTDMDGKKVQLIF